MDRKDSQLKCKVAVHHNELFTCVEYPGVVENKEKMLRTLGGIEHLQKVYNDPTKRMDLRFRPDDPGCKPVCGDRKPVTSFVVRVCKFKKKKKDVTHDEDEKNCYQQQISGIVTSIYSFTTLCDYQYLAVTKSDEACFNMRSNLQVKDLNLKGQSAFPYGVPLLLLPPTFSRLDKPQSYQYKKEDQQRSTKTVSKVGIHGLSNRKSRPNHCISINYEDKTPAAGLEEAVKVFDSLPAEFKVYGEKVKEAFDKRPVWSRNALVCQLNIQEQYMKLFLPLFAYYYITGPWARLWVRFGYDPKVDPSAQRYQLIDFRLRQGIHTPFIPIKPKRNTLKYKLPHLSTKVQPRDNVAITPLPKSKRSIQPQGNDGYEEINQNIQSKLSDATYLYKPGILPAYRHIFYQACDIHLPEAQVIIQKPSGNSTCSKDDGWFCPNTTAEIRSHLAKDVFRTISLLKDEDELQTKDSLQNKGSASDNLSQNFDLIEDQAAEGSLVADDTNAADKECFDSDSSYDDLAQSATQEVLLNADVIESDNDNSSLPEDTPEQDELCDEEDYIFRSAALFRDM
ncbi:unnamed protein product [Clavelina lepadiformis]|uniref:General transcription factor 3C polypeptide 5 n=2 Tax=Clavelina lepadiformis TaxID=159417 RepID=A0ABP0FB88_CLALP